MSIRTSNACLLAAIVSLSALVFVPAAAAEGEPDFTWDSTPVTGDQTECLYRYWNADAALVRVASPDSCTVHVWVNEDAVVVETPAAVESCTPKSVPTYYCVKPGDRCQVQHTTTGIVGTSREAWCVTLKGDCYVSYESTNWWGDSTYHCYVGPVAASGPECYDIHWEREVGPVTLEARSSCDVRVSVNDQPLGDLTTLGAAVGAPEVPPFVGYCVSLEGECYRGGSVCVVVSRQVPQCVKNPCGDGACTQAAGIPTPVEKCVDILTGGDMGYGVCVDRAGECKVSYYEVRFTGTYEYCLVGEGSCGDNCAASAAGLAECVDVLEGGDIGYAVCVYRAGPCAVSYRETTFLGTEEHCLVHRP